MSQEIKNIETHELISRNDVYGRIAYFQKRHKKDGTEYERFEGPCVVIWEANEKTLKRGREGLGPENNYILIENFLKEYKYLGKLKPRYKRILCNQIRE